MLFDINKNFNNDDNPWTNQQIIGHKDLFRGVIVKECAVPNQKPIESKSCDKVIINMCLKCCYGCWKRRCVTFYDPEAHKIFFEV